MSVVTAAVWIVWLSAIARIRFWSYYATRWARPGTRAHKAIVDWGFLAGVGLLATPWPEGFPDLLGVLMVIVPLVVVTVLRLRERSIE